MTLGNALWTALVFEQGQTIEAQRGLIREMLKDSTQLAALKDKLARDDGKQIHKKTDLGAPLRGQRDPIGRQNGRGNRRTP